MNDKNIEEKRIEYDYMQQNLFNHMYQEHGLLLTQSQMFDVIEACREYITSDTLTQYKNELDTLITHVLEHLEYNSNDESSKQTIVRLCKVIHKQLLNNE